MKTVLLKYVVWGMTRYATITQDQLMDAIAVVESNRGATSANVYQLKPIYVEDVCRITGQALTFEQAVGDDAVARACIQAYWTHYGARYCRLTGKRADAEVLARIHNGGPDGWNKEATRTYWWKVRKALLAKGFEIVIGGAK